MADDNGELGASDEIRAPDDVIVDSAPALKDDVASFTDYKTSKVDAQDNHVDIITRTSNFVDKNLQVIKGSLCVAAGAVVLGLVIRFRLFSKFRSPNDIPAEFYTKKQRLRGVVRRRCPNTDVLYVEHIPALRLRRTNKAASFSEGLLPLSLAGIRLTASGRLFIDNNLMDRRVWFRLMDIPSANGQSENYQEEVDQLRLLTPGDIYHSQDRVSSVRPNQSAVRADSESSALVTVECSDKSPHHEQPTIPSIITCRLERGVMRRNINLFLVTHGVARVKNYSEIEPGLLQYKTMVEDLVRAESDASRRGIGDWPSVSYYERFKDRMFFSMDRWKHKRAAKKSEKKSEERSAGSSEDMSKRKRISNFVTSYPARLKDKLQSLRRRKDE